MKWLFIIPIFLALLIVGISAYLQPSDFRKCRDKPDQTVCKTADAIIVISGGDTIARTQAGVELYRNGWAPVVIFSGAAFDVDSPSNAAAMRQYAVGNGVPENAIIIEEDAINTQQNASNTQSIIEQEKYKSVILVTSGYHQRRASLEFEKRASGVAVRNYPVTEDKDWGWYWWATPRGWWLAGGEMVKIIGFYAGVTEE